MLKMEYLLEEAKELGLPQTKKRAILREYLQTIILDGIYKSDFAKYMFFVGGTALRFFYNLPRFSEDLDFNNFSAILMSKGALLSEKLSALMSRRRGRYIYDVLFMLRKKFPFDRDVLYANNIREEPKAVVLNYLSGLSEKELKRLAEQVKPFLFREDDIELVLKAPQYGEKFLSKY